MHAFIFPKEMHSNDAYIHKGIGRFLIVVRMCRLANQWSTLQWLVCKYVCTYT